MRSYEDDVEATLFVRGPFRVLPFPEAIVEDMKTYDPEKRSPTEFQFKQERRGRNNRLEIHVTAERRVSYASREYTSLYVDWKEQKTF